MSGVQQASDSDTESEVDPSRVEYSRYGSERLRWIFNLFGIRSALEDEADQD